MLQTMKKDKIKLWGIKTMNSQELQEAIDNYNRKVKVLGLAPLELRIMDGKVRLIVVFIG